LNITNGYVQSPGEYSIFLDEEEAIYLGQNTNSLTTYFIVVTPTRVIEYQYD